MAADCHFGHAALALGLSQPQVSRHVAALERGLGVALFHRTPRQVVLTDGGTELLAAARETLAAADRLERRAGVVARGGRGSVAVGFIWSTLGGYLAPLVAAAAERHAHVELAVSQLRFTEIEPALRRGEVDLAVTRAFAPRPGLHVERLNSEPAVVAVPERHRLAGRSRITPADLHGEPLITLARATIPDVYELAQSRLREAGIVPSERREASTPSEALALVAAGLGIYYRVPVTAAAPHPGVVYRDIATEGQATLLVRRAVPPAPAAATIAALAHELFGDAQNASQDAPATLDAATVPA